MKMSHASLRPPHLAHKFKVWKAQYLRDKYLWGKDV